jgi:hypothetical protein
MSDTLLKLIPVDERFAPDQEAQQQACVLLRSLLPQAEATYVEMTPHVRFVDPGSNLEEIRCPICGSRIEVDWWQQEMEKAYQTQFADLSVGMPCCGGQSSLNHLEYHWPAGFARFVLVARNPGGDIDDDKISMIEGLLQCKLRKIWAHY